MPTLEKELMLLEKGYTCVAGVDEVGRGAWAGPIVAAAVILPHGFDVSTLRDSKAMTRNARERVFDQIEKQGASYALGIVEPGHIDKGGLTRANKRVMRSAVLGLPQQPDFVLVDGLMPITIPMEYELIVDGDAKISAIAAASIVAKVIRDRLMRGYHKIYPEYGFYNHVGYGTKQHQLAIKQYGVCALHRRSFRPIAQYLASGVI